MAAPESSTLRRRFFYDKHSLMRHLLSLVLSVVAAGALATWPQAQAGPASASVTIDFTAREAGELAQDLAATDLVLRVNGRPRAITSLQLVHLGGRPIDVVPPAFATNRPTVAGRTILFVADWPSIRAGRETALRNAVRAFSKSLDPGDRVALAVVPYDGLVVNFTTNHEDVMDRLTSGAGRALREEGSSEFACRSRVTLESIRGLLEGLSGGVGPTTVVLLSSAMAGPVRDAPANRFPGQCELRPVLFQDVADAATMARARVYVVEPEDAPNSGAARAGLEHIAGVTRGELLTLAGTGTDGLVRIVEDTRTFYLLTFDAQPNERNGSRHRLDLRATRPSVSITVQPEVFIHRVFADAPVTRRIAVDLLTDPRHFRDLTLRGTMYLSRDADAGKVRVVPLVEPVDADAVIESAAIGVYAADGTLVAQWASTPGVPVASPIAGALSVATGRYRVRVAATTHDGRAGVLDQDLDAILDGRGRWVVSSLVLGLSREGVFVPRLQFSNEPVAIGRVEIFGPLPSQGLVRFELARTPEGPAVVSVAGTITPTEDPGRYISTGALPIGGFLPGQWLVRAVVAPEGSSPLRVFRTLEKVK
jgi:hypothetical protein